MVTARRFIELARLEQVEATIGQVAEIVYLEDVRDGLSLSDKLSGRGREPGAVPAAPRSRAATEPAVILFTSGTEGEPKGVALSHRNILANVAQVRAHIELYRQSDVLFNPLPVFHCFGLTVGVLLPLDRRASRWSAIPPRCSRARSCGASGAWRHHPALDRHFHHPNMPAPASRAILTACGWRSAAPSGCATKPAPCSAANTASNCWKAMA